MTPVIEWDDQNPSVLESFVHWVLSAMKVSGGWTMPLVNLNILTLTEQTNDLLL